MSFAKSVWAGAVCLSILLAPTPSLARTDCRHALALGLDVSGSVDAREYHLQIKGLVDALGASSVVNALLSDPLSSVHLYVFEWSGLDDQTPLVGWSEISSESDISDIQDALRATVRRDATPGTALGDAMQTGMHALADRAYCDVRTLDISGDGKSNQGPEPSTIRDAFKKANITVNALVIGADSSGTGTLRQAEIGELSSYFRANVITGAEAFVQIALGYQDYARAMTAKLERELKTMIVSRY
ncbi:MAG: DUF1194 domain-containing protein [Paracoccaceae bacterium]